MIKKYSLTIAILIISLYNTQTIYSMGRDPMYSAYEPLYETPGGQTFNNSLSNSPAIQRINCRKARAMQADTASSDYGIQMSEAITLHNQEALLAIIASNPKAVHARPRNPMQHTLIMEAIYLQNLTALEILLEHGADADAPNILNDTALVCACRLTLLSHNHASKKAMIEMLLFANSALEIANNNNETAMSLEGPTIRAIVNNAQEIINTYLKQQDPANLVISYLNPFLGPLLYAQGRK